MLLKTMKEYKIQNLYECTSKRIQDITKMYEERHICWTGVVVVELSNNDGDILEIK